MRAARMLTDVVEKLLREHPQARDSRVVVRIYADVTNLSKQLAKAKLIGLEKRSIMSFAAGFTRAMAHFDFVDALDEEGTRFKIRGTSGGDQMSSEKLLQTDEDGLDQIQASSLKGTDVSTEAFKIAAEDTACSHILFAACHGKCYAIQ